MEPASSATMWQLESSPSCCRARAEETLLVPTMRRFGIPLTTNLLAWIQLRILRKWQSKCFTRSRMNDSNFFLSRQNRWGTLLTGEETTGGRLFEIQNPWASNPAGANIRWLTAVPIMAHEGIRFDSAGNLYTVDENNSGSVYKFVPSTYGDLSSGQAFVLKVDSYDGSFAGENWNSAGNTAASRDGVATWVPLTDASGVPLTTTDPFLTSNSDTGGRAAGDEVGATPYGRPEDMVISSTSGKEILYFTATSEPVVYSVELNYGGLSNKANVKKFVSRDTINLATGAPVGSELASPDNLAVDENGLIYVIEDQGPPNSDVWQAVDADGDGVAESVARFLTQGITGSEPTGLIFDPNTKRAIIAVQHPSSGNDAIWEITLGERNGQSPAAYPELDLLKPKE